jgi:hypothetical protein
MTNNKRILTKGVHISFSEAACKNEIEFIIFGGVAVRYYNCRDIDDVGDLDLMINPTRDNAERVDKLLQALHLNHRTWTVDDIVKPDKLKIINIKKTFDVEIFAFPTEEIDFNALIKQSKIELIENAEVKVISKLHLINVTRIALEKEKAELQRQQDKIVKLSKDLSCLEAV